MSIEQLTTAIETAMAPVVVANPALRYLSPYNAVLAAAVAAGYEALRADYETRIAELEAARG